jgi:hypothetical protein
VLENNGMRRTLGPKKEEITGEFRKLDEDL